MTKLRFRVVLLVLLFALTLSAVPRPASACEQLLCPELWEWSWSDCGCNCSSYECCQYYGIGFCRGPVCCDLFGAAYCPGENCPETLAAAGEPAPLACPSSAASPAAAAMTPAAPLPADGSERLPTTAADR